MRPHRSPASSLLLLLRRLAIAALLAALPALARAEEPAISLPDRTVPSLPGGVHDPRVRFDPERAPWRALGKLQATAGNLHASCTGALIGPTTVLTAAHCVFDIRTQRYFPPSSLHFLLGFARGNYVGHAHVLRFVTGPGYDPAEPHLTMGSDWAVLTIDAALGTPDRVLVIRAEPPVPGMPVMIGGYAQDDPLNLTGDAHCAVIGMLTDGNNRRLLQHDCVANHGVSGAPVLVKDGHGWEIAAVDVAMERDLAGGIAVLLAEALKR